MSMGVDRLKIATKEDGETKYLNNIVLAGTVTYTLDNEGQVLDNTAETANIIALLRSAEPEREFEIIGVES